MKRFALIGNPNSGKTTLYNILTGSTAKVGNWPGVTVEKREGTIKRGKEKSSVIDLPGIYSLSPYSPEEKITRNYLLNEKPDCVINIVDATNIERSLYLTTQILEIGIPTIIALNMNDVLKDRGLEVKLEEFKKLINIPVIEISALRKTNIKELVELMFEQTEEVAPVANYLKGNLLKLTNTIENRLKQEGYEHTLFHSIKFIESDELEATSHKKLLQFVEEAKETAGFKKDDDFEAVVADARFKYITENFSSLVVEDEKELNEEVVEKRIKNKERSKRIDKVLTNKWAAIPIFLAILFVVFHLVFSEDFLYLGAMGVDLGVNFEGSAFEGLFYNGGIMSPGVILANLINSITGLISTGVGDALASAEPWVSGLVVDGILGGLFAVIGFLPQILLLFLFFAILEDTGYMARIAFILDRIFRVFGVSGRAFIPMIMGFGCSIPAIMNTRTLRDENERIATIRVIPFFSCGAKLPILIGFVGALIGSFGFGNADLITYSIYLIGIVTAVATIIIMKRTTLKGENSPFLLELPDYRLPQAKSLFILLWDKAKHFFIKAFTIIFVSTVVIWVLSHFTFQWQFLSDENVNQSILANLGMLIQPLFTPIGFGSQIPAFGWVFAVAAITGLIAKENVIATLGALAATIGATISADLTEEVAFATAIVEATGITAGGVFAFIIFNMLTIPCFAAVASAKAELSKKTFNWTLVFWIVTSFVVSAIFYLAIDYVWTLAIIIPLIIGGFACLFIFNRPKKKEVI